MPSVEPPHDQGVDESCGLSWRSVMNLLPGRARAESETTNQSGTATLWVVAATALLAVVGSLATTVVAVIAAGREADTAADLAALSAAAKGSMSAGRSTHCDIARRIAAAHRAQMTACRAGPDFIEVHVEVQPHGPLGAWFTVRSQARAGPPRVVPP